MMIRRAEVAEVSQWRDLDAGAPRSMGRQSFLTLEQRIHIQNLQFMARVYSGAVEAIINSIAFF